MEHLILLFLYVSGQKSATDVTKKLPEDSPPLRVVELIAHTSDGADVIPVP